MKKFKFLFVLCATVIFVSSISAQRRFAGQVVEIVDGKTAVVQLNNGGKLTIILQFIEVPEPEQQLSETVKTHLERLLLGKTVEINPRGFSTVKTFGQIFLNGTDISRQLLRDGAAWYAISEENAQTGTERANYLDNEAQAKAEKRGVWSIEDLKPAWEFRAEKEEAKKAAERRERDRIQAEIDAKAEAKKQPKPIKQPSKPMLSDKFSSTWEAADISSPIFSENAQFGALGVPNADGLLINRNEELGSKLIMTTTQILDVKSGKSLRKLESGFGYLSVREASGSLREGFGMALKSESEKETFKVSNVLIFIADGKKINVGKAVQLGRQSDEKFEEMLIYTVDREAVAKISTAENLKIQVGNYSGEVSDKFHKMIKSLIIESTK